MKRITTIILIFTIITILSCNNGVEMADKTNKLPSIKDVPQSAWDKLAQKKIYFGHQSVGYNIVDGIKDVMKENPQIKLNIVETSNPKDFDNGIFAHSKIGENLNPKSKIDGFINLFKAREGSQYDIAAFKLCYVDISTETDVDNLFMYYKDCMDTLARQYPKVNFIYITTPLTSEPTGLKRLVKTGKNIIKKLLSKSNMYDNSIKLKFNDLIRKEYGQSGKLFDLAQIESTLPDGSRSYYKKNGMPVYSLSNMYTYDGGHLNELGRKIVAEQFLIFLANL